MKDKTKLTAADSAADNQRTDVASDTIEEPCPLATRGWIEIELVGEDDAPIKNQTYEITAPNGVVFKGMTNSKGKAKVESIPEGQCQVRFPDLDADAWEAVK